VTDVVEPRFKRRNYGSGHGYFVDGVRVPGVTTIVGAALPKGGLIKWAGDEVAEFVADRLVWRDGHLWADELLDEIRAIAKYPIPKTGFPRTKFAKELSFAPNRSKEAGGLRGTQVHKIAKILAETGEWTPGPEEEHLEGYGDALESWWHAWRPGPLVEGGPMLVERPVLNLDAFYAGTFDLLATHRYDDGSCIVCAALGPARVRPGCAGVVLTDYKAGKSGIFGETALQLAGYRYAQVYIDPTTGAEVPMPEIDHCLGVWLQGDGVHETRRLIAGPEEFRVFRYAYELAKFLDGPNLFKLEGDPPIRAVRGHPIRPKEIR
jgi:hypothetical protein